MVPPRERISALVDADLMVLPSKHEIFGISALEALMSGTPVIISSEAGIATVLEKAGAAVTVEYDDVDLLSSRITEYLTRSEKRRKMVKSGRKLIADKFDWEKIASDMLGLYKKIKRKAYNYE